MRILKEYLDFLANKLKESRNNPLEALVAFVVAWACTDSTNPFSISLRRMLGLPYVGKIEEAFSMIIARLSSDSAFRSKSIESLVLAIDRDWVRKNILEVAWKGAARELLKALKDLYEIRKAYSIKMLMQEVERTIIAQEEKTFETVPPPMSVSEEVVLPPQPREEEIKKVERETTQPQVEEVSALDELLDLFGDMKGSLKEIAEKLSQLVDATTAIIDHMKLIGETMINLPTIFKDELSKLNESIKAIGIEALPVRTREAASAQDIARRTFKERIGEEKLSESGKEGRKRAKETKALMEELEKALIEEELPIPVKTMQHLMVCLGNLNKLGEILRENVVPTRKLRWSIKVAVDEVVHEFILQGLYKDISEDEFQEIITNGVGLLITLPIKNVKVLQSVVDRLAILLHNLKFVILDGDTPVISFEKIKGAKIILQNIRKNTDLISTLKEKILPALA